VAAGVRQQFGVAMLRPRRAFPYYKVQILDRRSLSWKERKEGFDTLEEAREFVSRSLTDEKTRIVMVDEKGYHNLEDGSA